MHIHHAANTGFSKIATKYENGRPEYPAQLQQWLQQELALGIGSQVVDLGAGTGKFTQLLTQTGANVIAIEPIAEMRERITPHKQITAILAGSAEQIPLDDASVDLVVCAQAFHWFANHKALAEIHRILRPDGQLCLIWNTRDESVDWVAEISDLMRPLEGDTPRYYTGQWKVPFSTQSWFSEARYHALKHAHIGVFEQVIIDRFLSVSFIAVLKDNEQSQFLQQLYALRDQFPVLQTGTIEFPYRTDLWLYNKLD